MDFTQLGVGGILALVVIREVLNFLSKQRNGHKANTLEHLAARVERIAEQTDDLYRWHAKTDEDGVPLWYVRRSLEDTIKELTQAIRLQTAVLTDLHNEYKTLSRNVEQLSRG